MPHSDHVSKAHAIRIYDTHFGHIKRKSHRTVFCPAVTGRVCHSTYELSSGSGSAESSIPLHLVRLQT